MKLREVHFAIDSLRGNVITIFQNDDVTLMYIPNVTHESVRGGHSGVLHVSSETTEE